MIIFWRLVLGHMLADFTLQTNFINEWKRSSHLGMVAHCLMHPICYVILTYPFLSDIWVRFGPIPINGYLAVLFIGALHYIEDIWRVSTIRRFGAADNTLYLIWDQVIHLSVIFIFFGMGEGPSAEKFIPEAWPVIGILAVVATHFSVILIYFIEKDFRDKAFPDNVEKYLMVTERAAAFFALVLISQLRFAWALALVSLLLPRMGMLYAKHKVEVPPSMTWFVGSLIAIGAGLLGRTLI